MQKIVPFLWFIDDAEDAVSFYISLFPDSKMGAITRFSEDVPGPAGKTYTIDFTLAGQDYIALNGGPVEGFTTSSGIVSLFVNCDTQAEIDRLWDKLSDGGKVMQCGWLTDRFGITWQIVPAVLGRMIADKDPERARRVTRAMLSMEKFDIAALERAHRGT